MFQVKIINKTMDLSDLESVDSEEIIAELNSLIVTLKNRGLNISTWYGNFNYEGDTSISEVLNRGLDYKPVESAVDDRSFPWFLYWEIVWVIINAGFKKGQRVLDMGGSSSLFSYYLASKGFDVTTIDLQDNLVENANHVAKKMGWKLSNHLMDMKSMKFTSQFDHITSICVYEHIPVCERVKINNDIDRFLVPGGRFSITFDYRNPSRLAGINSPEDVSRQFIMPSHLKVRGNETFYDSGKNFLKHPFYCKEISLKYKIWSIIHGHFYPWEITRSKHENDYTFGALFLEKS